MVKCARCNGSAPTNPPCPRHLCGRCCDGTPPCDPSNHHKPRRKVRGSVGKGATSRKVAAWKEAHFRCRHLWRKDRIKALSRVLGVTPMAMHKATMKVIMAEARAQMGHAPPIEEATTQARETMEDVSVALLVSPQAEAEAVRSVLKSDSLREFLDEGVDDEELAGEFTPDWSGEMETEPEGGDTLHADAPGAASLVAASSGSAAAASTTASLRGEEVPVAPGLASAAASSSTLAWLGGPEQSQLAPLHEKEELSSTVTQPWVVKNMEGHPCAHWAWMDIATTSMSLSWWIGSAPSSTGTRAVEICSSRKRHPIHGQVMANRSPS